MICHSRKLLFVHIPKTGGTTIEQLLFPSSSADGLADYTSLCGWDNQLGWLNHLTIEQIGSQVGSWILERYRVFAIVRNPWERLVSEYHWKAETSMTNVSFSEFVKMVCYRDGQGLVEYYRSRVAMNQHICPQCTYVSGEVKYGVEIIRFEKYEQEVTLLLSLLGITVDRLPVIRRSDHAHYSRYYDSVLVDLVGNYYEKDVAAFGYDYDE